MFLTVDSFIARQEPWMQIKCEQVRQLLLTFPEIKERIRYQVPFYDCEGMLIYMGPYQKKRLMIGFCNGVQLKDPDGVLKNDAGQTLIRHYELYKAVEIDHEQLIRYIQEAIEVNQTLRKQKHETRNKSSSTK